MKHFVGIKHIMAEPCVKDGKEGYKVIYENGYESWSPKNVFEDAYVEVKEDRADVIAKRLQISARQMASIIERIDNV